MKLPLFSLLLLLSLAGCSSTRQVAKVDAAPGPAAATSAVAETVVLSPSQPGASAPMPATVPPATALPATAPPAKTVAVEEIVQKVPFKVSVSSVTVEKMAAQQGCKGGKGASLVTEKGPIEVYKMVCDNGKVFLAKCELRQCKAYRGG
jgi:PBP1b-binding outer membrane lipoprotein LpoB